MPAPPFGNHISPGTSELPEHRVVHSIARRVLDPQSSPSCLEIRHQLHQTCARERCRLTIPHRMQPRSIFFFYEADAACPCRFHVHQGDCFRDLVQNRVDSSPDFHDLKKIVTPQNPLLGRLTTPNRGPRTEEARHEVAAPKLARKPFKTITRAAAAIRGLAVVPTRLLRDGAEVMVTRSYGAAADTSRPGHGSPQHRKRAS